MTFLAEKLRRDDIVKVPGFQKNYNRKKKFVVVHIGLK